MASSHWTPAWGQAVSDYRGEDDEPGFDDVTVRMTVPVSIGGDALRVQLSNRFGDGPVHIGRAAIGAGGRFAEASFGGVPSIDLPAGSSVWTDPVALPVEAGAEVVVDLYLPLPTPYATAAGFHFDRSLPGDFAASGDFPLEGSTPAAADAREFPAPNSELVSAAEPDGTGWSLPAGGPFLRTIEVAGAEAGAVVVALGGSSTAMGWPQYTAELLPDRARIAVVNRGISGNRIRLDAPRQHPSWGRSGLARFDEDVLGTAGVTHLVIAYNSNDWGLPGRVTPIEEMPTIEQLIAGYGELVRRAEDAGIAVILATVTPLSPESRGDTQLEGLRLAVNEWVRNSGHVCVDFDAAIRSSEDPSRPEPALAAPDDTHPSVNGSRRLARAMADVLAPLL